MMVTSTRRRTRERVRRLRRRLRRRDGGALRRGRARARREETGQYCDSFHVAGLCKNSGQPRDALSNPLVRLFRKRQAHRVAAMANNRIVEIPLSTILTGGTFYNPILTIALDGLMSGASENLLLAGKPQRYGPAHDPQ